MKINLENYEQYALDYLEGGLTSDELLEFEKFLLIHPEVEAELVGISEISLQSDIEWVYPDKEKLYRKGKTFSLPVFYWTIAASVLLLMGAGLFFREWNPGSNTSDLSKIPYKKEIQTFSDEKINTGNAQTKNEENLNGEGEIAIRSQKSGSHIEIEIWGEKPSDTIVRTGSVAQKDESKELSKIEIKAPEIEMEPEDLNQLVFEETEFQEEPSLVQPLETISVSAHKVVYSSPVHHRIKDLEKQSFSSRTYHVHLPEEFFSEAWSDLSLNNIKGKLIPEFLKTKSK